MCVIGVRLRSAPETVFSHCCDSLSGLWPAPQVLEECASAATHVFGGNALDAGSIGRRVQPLFDSVKGFVVPAGSAKIMELQMTKLAVKYAQEARSKL